MVAPTLDRALAAKFKKERVMEEDAETSTEKMSPNLDACPEPGAAQSINWVPTPYDVRQLSMYHAIASYGKEGTADSAGIIYRAKAIEEYLNEVIERK